MEENTSERTPSSITIQKEDDRIIHTKSPNHRVEFVSGAFAASVNGGPTQVVMFRDVLPDVVEVLDIERDDAGKPVKTRSHKVELPGGPVREDVVTLVLTDSALKSIYDVLGLHLNTVDQKKVSDAKPPRPAIQE